MSSSVSNRQTRHCGQVAADDRHKLNAPAMLPRSSPYGNPHAEDKRIYDQSGERQGGERKPK
jgi:hypothetical protein